MKSSTALIVTLALGCAAALLAGIGCNVEPTPSGSSGSGGSTVGPHGCTVPPGGGSCDVFPQCGCPLGQKCGRESGKPEACEGIGSSPAGAACGSNADCGAMDVCVDSVCQPLCKGACGANHACIEIFYGTTDLGYAACEPHCNVTSPAQTDAQHVACAPGQTCLASSHTPGATVCATSTGNLPADASCTASTDCAPGMVCEPLKAGDTSGFCRSYCILGKTSCSSNHACVAFSPADMIDGGSLGVCMPMTVPDTCGSAWASGLFQSTCVDCLKQGCCAETAACAADEPYCRTCLQLACTNPDGATSTFKACMTGSCKVACGCNGAC